MRTILLLWALLLQVVAQDADATARMLAGLPLEGTSLSAYANVPAWREHARQMDAAWQQSELRQMAKIRAWAPGALGTIHTSQSPVFYFFSGPDILYAQALFPNAGTYVLCAREPVGRVANPADVPPSELPGSLAILRKSLTSLLNFSFFITKDLRVEIQQPHFTGILPVIEILLVRSGARIVDVEPAFCDKSGAVRVGPSGNGTPGARIRFTRGGGVQTVYYFAGDVSNGGLTAHQGVLRFCERLGRGQALLKAASYLPHEPGFSRIRQWLLGNTRTIIQDPSGIPFQYFDANWRLQLWGREGKPIELFAKYPQPALEAALAQAPRPLLPFGFGYQHLPSNAVMIIAERNAGAIATPAVTEPEAIPVAVPVQAGGLRR
jgi:hypothetical protein